VCNLTATLSLSERMARIRKTDTQPEILVRRLLHAMGYRFRLYVRGLPGNPDIALPRHRKVILVHGCFWHRHDCPDGRKLPRSKPEYWAPKLERNRRRDEANVARLRELGWGVLVLWECDIRKNERIAEVLARFLDDGSAQQAEARR
jgi:DNA mismatch endonuclease (patch repair protein)